MHTNKQILGEKRKQTTTTQIGMIILMIINNKTNKSIWKITSITEHSEGH